MNLSISKTMQAVLIEKNGGLPVVREIPVPVPGPGEVLVRMAAAPINPSDIGFMKGVYGTHRSLPVVPGFEGSGTVVAAGKGLFPRLLLGRRVACSASTSAGTWAEYLAAPATLCVPLKQNISLEQGAMMLVNPLTALAFYSLARRGKHAALVNTAAAGALGRMVLRLGIRLRFPVVNIVMRREQAELLHFLGAEYVLESNAPDFDVAMHTMMTKLNATLVFDAVGGDLFQKLLVAAPVGSTLIRYANLSGEERATADPSILRKEKKRIESFFLGDWARHRNLLDVLRDIHTIRKWGPTDLQSHVQKRFPLSDVQRAVETYQADMTAGKVLLVADPAGRPD